MRNFCSKNPFKPGAAGQVFDYISPDNLSLAIKRSHAAFLKHSALPIEKRAEGIARLGKAIREDRDKISKIITEEVGKPITQSQGEVDKAANFCDYFSKEWKPLLPERVKSDASKYTEVRYTPMGVIHYILPFNFPFYLNFKGGLPNLLLGNTLLARNADSCPRVGLAVEEVFHKAGFTNGQYINVFTKQEQLKDVLKTNQVQGVSFTGSSDAGTKIAETAGQYLKKCVLELGGNDPFVVLKGADLAKCASDAVKARCANAGQVCFSPKRYVLVNEIADEFIKLLTAELSKLKFGDPMNRDTQVGPLAREDLHSNLTKQMQSLPKSWKVLYQRKEMAFPFYPITILEGNQKDYVDKEFFGPVFTVYRAENKAKAIEIANEGTFGLAASCYGETDQAEEALSQIRCGMGFVNSTAKSDVYFPSGGVWRSGYGRECGTEGYRQFANARTHYVNNK